MKSLLFVCIGLMLYACSDTSTPGILPPLISPRNADLITMHLKMPEGTQRIIGQLPSSGNDGAPRVTIDNPNVLSSNGATTPIHVSYEYAAKNVEGFYAQVEGSSLYFKIPYHGPSNSGQVQLPIGLPANVDQGKFCISFCAFDVDGRAGNVAKAWMTVLRLGTGLVQINLTWDNTTDQDLYVYDPMGEEIYCDRPSSDSKGIMDRHDNDGFGPENIYWSDAAPDGVYTVAVKDKTGNGGTSNFIVTVSSNEVSRDFSGTTVNGNKITVITFTKTGDSISF